MSDSQVIRSKKSKLILRANISLDQTYLATQFFFFSYFVETLCTSASLGAIH